MDVTNTPPLTLSTPPTTSGFSLSAPLTACTGTQTGTASIDAEPGVTLGQTFTSVTMSFNGAVVSANDDTPVTVVDSTGDTAVPDALGNPTGTVFQGYISAPAIRTPTCCPHSTPARS